MGNSALLASSRDQTASKEEDDLLQQMVSVIVR